MKHSRYGHYGVMVVAWSLVFLAASFSLPGLSGELSAAGMTTIRLSESSEVEGKEMLLGSIAEIDGPDMNLKRSLEKVLVGKSPPPGKSRRLDAQYLKLRLRQNRIDLSAVQLIMPAAVTVTRSHVEIKKVEIEQIVSGFIRSNLSAEYETARITNIRVPERLVLPKGRITYDVRLPGNAELMGNCPLSVTFIVNESFKKRIWTSATIEFLTDVLVTRKPIGRHKPITENDIELVQMDLAKLPANALADPDVVLGQRAKRALNAGTVLRTNLVELPPLVKRGDMVVIVLESKGLKITALGQVKRKGKLGERIPVINFDSKKVLYAQVVDANTVKVNF